MNVFPIVKILAVPHMDFVASLLTIATVKAASILEPQFQIIVIYVIFASIYISLFFLKAVYFYFYFHFFSWGLSLLSIIAYYITETLPNIKCGESECVPNSLNPCCSPHGYCGISVDHCECEGCIDSRLKTPQIGN